jgi:anionic cell wall polymer biosynthesis LytR-Cps2A-Psr (LCP) family protein
MKNKLAKQDGFAVFEVLFFVLVVAILVGAAYYVGKNHSSVKSSSNSQSSNSSSNKVLTAQKYLNIPELGIRLKLSDKNADTYYVMTSPSNTYVVLTSKALDTLAAKTPGCEGANKASTLSKIKPGDDNFGSPWTEDELKNAGDRPSKKIGDYYIVSVPGQSCFPPASDEAITQVGNLLVKLPGPEDAEVLSN